MLNGDSAGKESGLSENLSDQELIVLYRSGDQSAFSELALRYILLIQKRVYELHSADVEKDDLFQEGLIALHGAACSFDPQGSASFRTYAGVCIKNRLISAVRSAHADKNKINSDTVSLESAQEFIPDDDSNPEDNFIMREKLETLQKRIQDSLSELEQKVLLLYLQGKSYEEISSELEITVKACGNALQRVRSKLRVLL